MIAVKSFACAFCAAGKDRYVRGREEPALHLSGSTVRVVLQPKK